MTVWRVTTMVVLALCCPTDTQALESGGAGGIVLGNRKFDLDELDAAMSARGFSAVESSDFGGGIWGYKIVDGRIIIGARTVGSRQTTFNDSSQATVNVGGLVLDLGYIVLQQSDVVVYPLVGLGMSGIDVRITERRASPTFDEVLDRPSRESEMREGGLVLHAGLGIDYLLKLGERHRHRRGFLFGVRVGYTYDPTEGSWEWEEGDVLGGPDVSSSGPFVHFSIGWGSFRD